MNIKVNKLAYHRNGISGEPFYLIAFTDLELNAEMLAVVFGIPCCVAVFDPRMAADGIIEFGQNSWRGDYYETALRSAIKSHEEAE